MTSALTQRGSICKRFANAPSRLGCPGGSGSSDTEGSAPGKERSSVGDGDLLRIFGESFLVKRAARSSDIGGMAASQRDAELNGKAHGWAARAIRAQGASSPGRAL